ncbi:MFS transporter [Phytobacter sp. V91]|uniref:MFS transporter n=1 Tax=Phytobacter sp. V91 TaxID=3369425 RepID=UPI003F627BCB
MSRDTQRLPLMPLLTLCMAAFVTIVTEALPAGLLTPMAQDLHITMAAAGQSVTVYAIGSFVAAIPLMSLLQGWRRRRLLLITLAGFTLANTVTAFATSYSLMLAARAIAGVAAGVLWAQLAGYAASMAPAHKRGKAIAIAMAGTPLALSVGVPLGTFTGNLIGWRLCFAALSVMSLVLMIILRLTAPEVAGQSVQQRLPLRSVLRLDGVRRLLLVVLTFVLAHNLLYTYISPLLEPAGMAARTDAVLLLFGLCSLVSIAVTGILVDRHLYRLTLLSIGLFLMAALLLPLHAAIWWAVALWGLAFGGAATLFQTEMVHRAEAATDVAQSMLVTVWNLAIAGGGMLGGLLLESSGVSGFAPVLFLLLLVAIWMARKPSQSGAARNTVAR